MAGKRMLVAISLVAALALQCGREAKDPEVITLAGRSVLLSTIVRDYDRLNEANPWSVASPEERGRFVETYARKEVLLQKAREQCGPDLPDREQRLFNRWLDQREADALWSVVLDAKGFDQQRQDSIRAVKSVQRQFSHVNTLFEKDVRAIYARVQAGEDFAKVCREADAASEQISYFENLSHDRSEMPLEMADVLFALEKPGQISEPFPSARYGWHLIRFDGERTIDPSLDEKAQEKAEMSYRQGRQFREEQRIRDKYRFEIVSSENVSVMQKGFAPFYDSLTGGNTKQFTVDFGRLRMPFANYTAEELARPLVRWQGGAWTIRDYLESLQSVHLYFWPSTGDQAAVGQRVLRRMEQWAARQEAAEKGLLSTEQFLADKQRKLDELTLDCFYGRSIQDYDFQVTVEQVQAYWQERKEKYMSPDEVTFGFIYFPGELRELATQGYQRLQQGAAWEEVGAQMARRDRRIVFEALMTPAKEYSYPDVRDQALKFDVRPDGSPFVAEPIEVRGDWLLLKIFTRSRPVVLDFQGAAEQAHRDLVGERMEERLLSLLDEFSKEYGLKINQKAIE